MTTTEWRSIGHNLYIKSAFSDASYDLWITDMYRSWHEHLNKKQIIHRANDNGLQIDLSDSNNLRIVLGHLQKSLQADDRINADTSQEEEYLVLAAEISLPKPLPVASWIFRPASCTPDEFREQVTGPLFDKIHKQEQSEIDLIQRLKDKDHVIERLLDQVAKVNVDISTIFPALAGHANARKGMSKDEAEALVPALAPFDSQAWQEEIRQGKFYRGHTGSKTVDTDHTEDEMDVEVVYPTFHGE
ncbi:hypothetical protein EJ08DRAFT_429713 [Tothia fuscella]|uniref:Non-homologous end-joining factor 1 n=1 Tax=Tothia fuscella TaxID=1048955 RepID=A0A9P4U1K8_9PEZI|nr:hypothetical protein EJ08DRAFT_429713 [Tothia fuscella]